MNTTKTTISGSGKNLEGAEWSNLGDNYCPFCDADLESNNVEHRCTQCNFKISNKRFIELRDSLEENGGEGTFNDWLMENDY